MRLVEPLELEGQKIHYTYDWLVDRLQHLQVVRTKRTAPDELELYRQLIDKYKLQIALIEKLFYGTLIKLLLLNNYYDENQKVEQKT